VNVCSSTLSKDLCDTKLTPYLAFFLESNCIWLWPFDIDEMSRMRLLSKACNLLLLSCLTIFLLHEKNTQ